MDAYIKKIYDMLYSPILTPYNLLENAKIENYNYVKYYKHDDGLITEMECEVSGKTEVYYYYFNAKDYLQQIYIILNGQKEILFDRNNAIEAAKLEYYLHKPDCKAAI